MNRRILLVGDNPFHGISHLSQQRSIERGSASINPATAADLVLTALESGADGFTFSVSSSILSVLKTIREKQKTSDLKLFAMVPYAFEYVRVATQVGTPGLAKRFAEQIVLSKDIIAIALGFRSVITTDPKALLGAYLMYEISRIRSCAGKQANLVSVILNETITDMALGLNLRWMFETYLDFMLRRKIKPGFNTRNFPYLVSKFDEWQIDMSDVIVATPFNKVGFQMNPSRVECEKALEDVPQSEVIAISILAAGYLKPPEAADYIATLPNIKGVAVGVSKEQHARETFRLLKEKLER